MWDKKERSRKKRANAGAITPLFCHHGALASSNVQAKPMLAQSLGKARHSPALVSGERTKGSRSMIVQDFAKRDGSTYPPPPQHTQEPEDMGGSVAVGRTHRRSEFPMA